MLSTGIVEEIGNPLSVVSPKFSYDYDQFVDPAISINATPLDIKAPAWSEVSVPTRTNTLDDTDLSSLDSLTLTDSPDGTTASSNSHRSSYSSLSGMGLKASLAAGKANSLLRCNKAIRRNETTMSIPNGLLTTELDRSIKNEYTVLKSQASKFGSRQNGVKANYLRLTLLPFLRRRKVRLLTATTESEINVQALSLWWNHILDVAKNNFRHINGVDRNLFYEAISALLARPEWSRKQSSPSYQHLLAQTTAHVLAKSAGLGSLTIAQAAFTGKVLAYAYFYLQGFAHYLLSQLDIDESAITRITGTDSTVASAFPPNFTCAHLVPLINARQLPRNINLKKALSWLPIDQCHGWSRHFSANSPMFASFFKHFCSLQSRYLQLDDRIDEPEFEGGRLASLNAIAVEAERSERLLLESPGMLLIMAYIVGMLDQIVSEANRSSSPRNSFRQPRPSRSSSTDATNIMNGRSYNAGLTDWEKMKGTGTDKVRIDLLKVFSVIREILHCDEETTPYFLVFSKLFDRMFKAMASRIRVHDMEGCVTVCDIAEEWFSSVLAVRASKCNNVIANYRQIMLDWDFWLDVVKRMLQSDNCHTEIRAISLLFNVWPHLPNDERLPSRTSTSDSHTKAEDPAENTSILRNVTKWLLSEPIWLQFFCHWSPLVRSYFQRLLCFRLASVGVGLNTWFLDVEAAQDLEESRQMLKKMLTYTYAWCDSLNQSTEMKPELDPSLPLPRLRVGIRRFGPLPAVAGAKVETNVSRAFPFDIFDSVAYWKANKDEDDADDDVIQALQDLDTLTITSSNRLGRSNSKKSNLSRASRASFSSIESVRSNASVSSTLSISSVKSQLRRFSMTNFKSSSKPKDAKAIETYDDASTMNTESKAKETKTIDNSAATAMPPKEKETSWKRRLSIWGKSKTTKSTDATKSGAVSSSASSMLVDGSHAESKTDKGSQKVSISAMTPAQLTQPRPDIIRPAYRFIMVPTNSRPPCRSTLALPRLPFETETTPVNDSFNPDARPVEKDLAIWNYGGRSLAEWNIEVSCFEMFAQQQRQLVDDTMEMFNMPFLVAEIPWRVSA